MSAVRRLHDWVKWHSIRAHVVGPIWLRVPEKARWRIVGWLNHSQRRCWCDLVDDALAYPETDPCDVHVPSLQGGRAIRCASVCDWSHPQHAGNHACSCYCGKFEFTATQGAIERADVAS